MDNIRQKAVEISNKFPFSKFETSAESINKQDDTVEDDSICKNHLDMDFMKLLENGAHLDTSRMPL